MNAKDDATRAARPRRLLAWPGVLVVRRGPVDGDDCVVFDSMTVGRAPGCGIVLDDPRVSDRHFSLSVRGRSVELVDLGSANGTRVNGEPVQRAVLKHADIIAVGDSALVYNAPGEGQRLPLWPLLVAVAAAVVAMLPLLLFSIHRDRVDAEAAAIRARARALENIGDWPGAVAEYRRLGLLRPGSGSDGDIRHLDSLILLDRDLDRVALLVQARDMTGARVIVDGLRNRGTSTPGLVRMSHFLSLGPPALERYCEALQLADWGRYNDALQVLEELYAVSLDPAAASEEAEVLFKMAAASIKVRDRERAEYLLRQVLTRDPNHPTAQRVLDELDSIVETVSAGTGSTWLPAGPEEGHLHTMEASA